MSLKNNKGIIKIRRKLDSLDNRLLNIIKIRTKLVNKIIKNKTSKNQIVDNARIKIILKNIKKKSLRKKIDIKLTQKIWKSMIKAYIDFEYRKFKKK
tara:strand:+ start:1108 stop:1398 length:291 start_codon:yes stop_codon:yes gene_type:complete